MQAGTRASKITPAATLCVLVLAFPALAHDHAGHAKHHDDFYRHLKQPGTNVSCCNNQDCRPAPHRVTPNGVEFFVGSKWITTPTERLIEHERTEVGHWCGLNENTTDPITFCAIVPRGGV